MIVVQKRMSLLLLLCFLFTNGMGQNGENSQPGKDEFKRTTQLLNRDWRFKSGDVAGAQLPGFSDQTWEYVGLPHSFSIPYFMSAEFYTGYGWYRKRFTITPGFRNRKYFIEFEAVFQDAEVFVNGKKAGSHTGGYTGFILDVSELLVEGENLLAVRVNNNWQPGVAPRAGEHVFSGGIYRDVYLVSTDQVHLEWCGTAITTPHVSRSSAVVKVQAAVRNETQKAGLIQLKTVILDPAGKKVAQMLSSQKIAPGATFEFVQTSKGVKQPKRWHPDHPFLYAAVTSVYHNGVFVDEQKTQFGIRTVRWTADSGFYLNDEPLYLRGANVHQDHAGWGDAVTNEGFYRDVKMMKDAGFNFIRGSHYPHDPAFVKACDELGMLFWSENVFWGIGGSTNTPEGSWISSAYPTKEKDRAPFESSLKQQLVEMIRIHRNSPAVIAWSMSNEPFFSTKETMPYVRNLLKELVTLSKKTDPTRPAAIGGAQRPIDSMRIDLLGDVAGYNGDGGTLPVFHDPGVPSLVSEYGSTTADRPGKYEPGWGDIAKDNGQHVYGWRSGQAIWCGFDHGSVAGARLGKMGLVDYFRIPKRAWYWYRNEYMGIAPPEWPQSGIPAALKLEVNKSAANTDGTDDVQLLITVLDASGKPISNNPPVELKVVEGPGIFPTGKLIRFEEKSDCRILDGKAAMSLRSWYAGRAVIRASSPGLGSAEVSVVFSGVVPYVKGQTIETEERIYTRYALGSFEKVSQHFGVNNPSYGSSSEQGHAAGFAVDGNSSTWWRAAKHDMAPSWWLDTEKRLSLHSVLLTFPRNEVQRFVLEVSENGADWKIVADLLSNKESMRFKHFDVRGITGGIVRVRFPDAVSAQLAEVDVTGVVID